MKLRVTMIFNFCTSIMGLRVHVCHNLPQLEPIPDEGIGPNQVRMIVQLFFRLVRGGL